MDARQRRAQEILALLRQAYPEARCALNFSNPLELLVATILSAQCTDERVNQVTRTLFQRYRTAADYATADPDELAEAIKPTGYYRQKAQTLQRCCAALVEHYGGQVPDEMDALVRLPGVGRKTANVVLGNAFNKPQGIVVDTHVKRLAQRLGLTQARDPEKIERDLMRLLPRQEWTLFAHLLIFHGRAVCKARVPRCDRCPIHHLCPSCRLHDHPQARDAQSASG
ncbi:MAG: endonuclease III [Candidatus Tectimicrobiota bacterium]|nr:MAG: endonuclease III [Candidatus Tectomicrobia bacterium]